MSNHDQLSPRRSLTTSGTSAVEAARRYGVDIEQLRASLRLTPDERLRRLNDDMEFIRAIRRVTPTDSRDV